MIKITPSFFLNSTLVATSLSLSAYVYAETGTLIPEEVPVTHEQFLDDTDNFQFVIIGDRTGGHRPGVFETAIGQVNLLQPEFAVSVGDLIEGYTESQKEISQQWDEVETMVAKLQMPFFYVVGNHDVSNPAMLDIWKSRRGADYYYFVYKDVLFVGLNTEDPAFKMPENLLTRTLQMENLMHEDPVGTQQMILDRSRQMRASQTSETTVELPGAVNISERQLDFVKSVLEEHESVRWTFLLMHKPAWQYDSEEFRKIEDLLSDRNYTAIAGHEHYYEYTERKNADYIVMGTTGGVWLNDGPGAVDHISVVTMTGSGPVFATIRLSGLSDKTGVIINDWPDNKQN